GPGGGDDGDDEEESSEDEEDDEMDVSSGTTLSRLYAWPRGARAGTTFTRLCPGSRAC
nr:hypothetical protein [Tanacetum cinerariifolium]